jgi:hypothetical protein
VHLICLDLHTKLTSCRPDVNTPKYMVEFNKFMRGQASRHFAKLEYLPLTGAVICDRDRLQVSVHQTIELWWQSYCETQAIIKTRRGPVTVTPEQEQRARELQFDKKVSRLVQLMMIYEEVIQEEASSSLPIQSLVQDSDNRV